MYIIGQRAIFARFLLHKSQKITQKRNKALQKQQKKAIFAENNNKI